MHYPSYRPVLSFLTGFFIAASVIGYGVLQALAVTSSEAPTNAAVDQITVSSMRLSWRDSSQGETVFRIERSTNGTNYTEVGSLSSTSANTTGSTYYYTNSGMNSLTSNTKYWYRVRACNGNPVAYQRGMVYLATVNSGECTGYGTASPKYTLANTPVSCSGIADNADPTRINWTWVSGGAQSGYYASDSAGNTGWVTRTYWNQTGLTCGTSYTLNVKARNGDLVQTSAVSCAAFTLSCQTLPAPANMRHTGNGTGDIVWAWDPVSSATMYTTEKSNDGSTFTWAGDITGTSIQQTTDYNQSPLVPNTKYYFRVAAQNANSTSPYSLASAYTSIQSATGASFSGVGQTSFTANASGAISAPNPNTGSYTNYIRFELHNNADTACSQASLQDSGWKNTASHTFNSGLTANTTYKVCIQTRNGDGDANAETGMYSVTTLQSGQTCGDNLQAVTERDYDEFNCVNPTTGKREWSVPNGDSTSSCWQNKCCGDDSNEYALIETFCDNVGYCVTVGTSNQYCCNVLDPVCVTNDGVCHQAGVLTFGTGNDKYSVCSNFGDLGGLYSQGLGIYDCDLAPVVEPCLTGVCKGNYKDAENHWASPVAGETGVGEYPDVNGTQACCGDDANEFNITMYCSGYSGGPKCCNSSSDKIDASGNCVASCPTGDTTPPAVSVSGIPSKWQNTNSSASVACSDTGSGCSSSSYKLKAYASAVTCSKNYADYTLSSPQTVTGHTFYCAAAKDIAGNAGYSSTAAEFKVDKTAPVVSNALAHCDSYTDTCATDNDATIYFTWSLSDSGGSGLSSCTAELNDTTPDESAGVSGKDTDTGRKGSNAYYVQCKDAAGNASSVINDGISIGVK